MKHVTEVWRVEEHECQCPKCKNYCTILNEEFAYHADLDYGQGAEVTCEACDLTFLAIKPEGE